MEFVKEISSIDHKCLIVTFNEESIFTIKFNGEGAKSIQVIYLNIFGLQSVVTKLNSLKELAIYFENI